MPTYFLSVILYKSYTLKSTYGNHSNYYSNANQVVGYPEKYRTSSIVATLANTSGYFYIGFIDNVNFSLAPSYTNNCSIYVQKLPAALPDKRSLHWSHRFAFREDLWPTSGISGGW